MKKEKEEKSLPEAGVVFVKDKKGRFLFARKVEDRDPNEVKIGEGRRNGLGGGRKPEETQKKAVIREAREECGIVLHKKYVKLQAIVFCHNEKKDGSIFVCKLYVFVATRWKGVISDSEEMIDAAWFAKNKIPYEQMIATDKDWLPFVLDGKKIFACVFLKNSQSEKIGETEIKFVKKFSRKRSVRMFKKHRGLFLFSQLYT